MRVVVGHTSSYLDSLVAPAGTRLRVEPRSSEFAGWIWCRDSSGTGAWVPEAFLEIEEDGAVLTVDYDSTELTVALGAVVEVLSDVAGWAWCLAPDGGFGWVPVGNLRAENDEEE